MQAVQEPINLQPIEDPVAPHLFELNDSNNLTFHDYIRISLANHCRDINVTWREVLVDSGPFLMSWILGYLAALVYVGYAGEEAESLREYYLYIFGAVVLNTLVNYFFQFETIAPPVQACFEQNTPEEEDALIRLEGRSTNFWAKTGNILWRGFLESATFAGAALAAYPMFAADVKKKEHALWLSLVIFGSTTILQKKGVEELVIKKILPQMWSGISWIYRKHSRSAQLNYQKEQDIHALRSAHIEALKTSYEGFFLAKLQTDKREELRALINLSNKIEPQFKDTNEYIVRLLLSAPKDSVQFSQFWRYFTQTVGLLCVGGSMPAWQKVTVESIAEYKNIPSDSKEAWEIGSAVFAVSAALTIWVAIEMFGTTYDVVAYALNGIRKAWQTKSFSEFVKDAWNNKFNMASWYEILRLSRSIQQNPRTLLSVITFLYILSYFSTQSSTNLNYDELGRMAGDILKLPTIIAIISFNIFPIPVILERIQRFLTRLFGKRENIEEIKIERFYEDQIKLANSMTDEKFLELLRSFGWNGQSDPDQLEEKLKVFCGNKTAKEIFGENHELAILPLRQVVQSLESPEKTEITKAVTDFFRSFRRRDQEGTPLRVFNGDSSHNSAHLLRMRN